MAAPERLITFDHDDRTYRLVFTNAARAVVEETLGMEWPEIGAKIDQVGIGPRLQGALLFGATRKYNRRELPNLGSAYALLDSLEEVGEDEQIEFMAALFAAFYGVEKQLWLDILNGIEPEEDEEDEVPKEKPPPKKKSTKAANSGSETGTDS